MATNWKSETSNRDDFSTDPDFIDSSRNLCTRHGYRVTRLLGSGAFGAAVRCQTTWCGSEVVIKLIRTEKVEWVITEDGERVPYEAVTLASLHHDNIVKLLNLHLDDRVQALVMESAPEATNLLHFLNVWNAIDEALASHLFRQLAAAVEHIHTIGFAHLDIKADNVLVDNRFHVQLIDFGLARCLHDTPIIKGRYGAMGHMPREILQDKWFYAPAVDVYAIGVVLYLLVFTEYPYYTDAEAIAGELKFPPETVSSELKSLSRHMLCADPAYRACMRDVTSHAWTHQPVDLGRYNFERPQTLWGPERHAELGAKMLGEEPGEEWLEEGNSPASRAAPCMHEITLTPPLLPPSNYTFIRHIHEQRLTPSSGGAGKLCGPTIADFHAKCLQNILVVQPEPERDEQPSCKRRRIDTASPPVTAQMSIVNPQEVGANEDVVTVEDDRNDATDDVNGTDGATNATSASATGTTAVKSALTVATQTSVAGNGLESCDDDVDDVTENVTEDVTECLGDLHQVHRYGCNCKKP